MSKCDYCGRENREGALFCDRCGTDLNSSLRSTGVLRPMNARERRRAWRALAVTAMCAVAAWLFTWKALDRWDFVKGCIVAFGLSYAVGEMSELRKSRIQPETREKRA